jgi:hypothetical protein
MLYSKKTKFLIITVVRTLDTNIVLVYIFRTRDIFHRPVLATRTHIHMLMKPGMLVIWCEWGERTAGAEFHLRTQVVTHHLSVILSGNTETEAETRYFENHTIC